MAQASPFELSQLDAAQAAIDGNNRILALEAGADTGTDLYHLLASLLTWSDAWGVDFDEILSQLRADAHNFTATASKFAPAAYEARAIDPAERLATIRAHLLDDAPDSVVVENEESAEREARLDLVTLAGQEIGVRFVKAFVGETNDQTEILATDSNGEPLRVIVEAEDPRNALTWGDPEDLDVYLSVRPAPGETRLEGLRSIWTYGVSYKVREPTGWDEG